MYTYHQNLISIVLIYLQTKLSQREAILSFSQGSPAFMPVSYITLHHVHIKIRQAQSA